MAKFGGVILLVLGIIVGGAGGIGAYLTPEKHVTVSGEIDSPVLMIPAGVVALAEDYDVTITGTGVLDLRTARPVDAEAWVRWSDASIIRGISSWEALDVGATWRYTGDDRAPSDDIWRNVTTTAGAVEFTGADIERGVTVVVVATSGVLEIISFDITRDVGFAWVPPAVSGGALMAAAGIVLLVFRFLDVRPSAAKVEEVAAKVRNRSKNTSPGVRRARREAAEGEDGLVGAGGAQGKRGPAKAKAATDDSVGSTRAKLTKRIKVKKDATKEAEK